MSAKEKTPLYTLAPNEEILFELNIDYVSLCGEEKENIISALLGIATGIITKIVKTIFPCCCKKPGEGILVVTNSRCLIVYREKTRYFLGFTGYETRNFWTFPRRAITEWHSYEKSASTFCWCCTRQEFLITIGIDDEDGQFDKLTFGSYDITSDEEAQALISKLIEVSQKS